MYLFSFLANGWDAGREHRVLRVPDTLVSCSYTREIKTQNKRTRSVWEKKEERLPNVFNFKEHLTHVNIE